MPRIEGTTDSQTLFLRAFHTHPDGPPPNLWPSPAIFRKWMRSPAFASAMDDILSTFRFQSDLHLAALANRAAQSLYEPSSIENLHVLRLSHLRQRFESDNDRVMTVRQIFGFMRCFNPKTPVALVLQAFKTSYSHAFKPGDDEFHVPTKAQIDQLIAECPREYFSDKDLEPQPAFNPEEDSDALDDVEDDDTPMIEPNPTPNTPNPIPDTPTPQSTTAISQLASTPQPAIPSQATKGAP